MKSQAPTLIILTSLFIFIGLIQSAYSQFGVRTIHNVQKIYLESIPSVKDERNIEQFLKIQLEKQGFEIVDDASKADAILSGEIQAEITIHGDKNTSDKSIYLYQLTLTNKRIIWKSRIKFVSKSNFAEDDEYAAQRIAKKLAKDFSMSSKKPGTK